MTSLFEDVRARVRMSDAISYLCLKPTETKGDQLRFSCPACAGDDRRALSVNIRDEKFQCFRGKKGGNDATALTAHVKGISQTVAAKLLAEAFPAVRGSSTEARRPTAELKGRDGDANVPVSLELDHPVIEMLGINRRILGDVGGGFDGDRIVIPLRDAEGNVKGELGIATKADQAPLLLFSESVPAEKESPDELRKLFRVV
jgi:hypothetical protein